MKPAKVDEYEVESRKLDRFCAHANFWLIPVIVLGDMYFNHLSLLAFLAFPVIYFGQKTIEYGKTIEQLQQKVASLEVRESTNSENMELISTNS